MKIQTKPFGETEIGERQIVNFPHGLFGFQDLHRFALLDAAQPPFYWLQSLDQVQIAFVLIDPLFFRPDYNPDVDPAELEEIGIHEGDDALVFAIVTIPQDSRRMTANLQGPLIINRETHAARQLISLNPRWTVRHVIMDEMGTDPRTPPGAEGGADSGADRGAGSGDNPRAGRT
jgi:flagellar assembly factor FliW